MPETKKKAEQIELGTFEAKAINDEGAESRLSDERNQSYFVGKFKGGNKQLERGATYRLLAEKVADAPGIATVTATIRAEDVGSLPRSAVIEKGEVVTEVK